jgi:hypothetical protein
MDVIVEMQGAIGRITIDAKSYARIAVIIFTIVALLQLARAVSGWEITINCAAVPLWASWLATVVATAGFVHRLDVPRMD